ncbi:MAG TPA: aspartate kinase [Gammaproteobacteria bacterium]|nr:aspartate kinase [Gammaproteobacteria bacterium]
MHAVTQLKPSDAAAANRTLLFIAGHTGHVGSALLMQLGTQQTRWRADGLTLANAGFANREELLLAQPDEHGATEPRPRAPNDWQDVIRHLGRLPARARLFVDCTGDAGVAALYPDLLAAGIGVVTPSKLAQSGTQQDWDALKRHAREQGVAFAYETSVGAALPVLGPLADLVARGDRVRRIEAVLSGTLSYVFQQLNHDVPFSAALREALARGYAEPHPATDLTGRDTARKLLILMRTAGLQWEPERVHTETLLPAELASETDPERFLLQLAEGDADWRRRADAARRRSLRLAYLARFDGRRAVVGVTHVAANESFALLEPGENLVRIWSDHYATVPLSIAGPGAGPAVTAAGVLSDILKAATA